MALMIMKMEFLADQVVDVSIIIRLEQHNNHQKIQENLGFKTMDMLAVKVPDHQPGNLVQVVVQVVLLVMVIQTIVEKQVRAVQ